MVCSSHMIILGCNYCSLVCSVAGSRANCRSQKRRANHIRDITRDRHATSDVLHMLRFTEARSRAKRIEGAELAGSHKLALDHHDRENRRDGAPKGVAREGDACKRRRC